MKPLILAVLLDTVRLTGAADAATPSPADPPGATATPPISSTPSDLTDRERWMVQRIESLERRLAELESGGSSGTGLARQSVSAPAAAFPEAAPKQKTEKPEPFAGPGGVTPPGGNSGPAGSVVPGFVPDLVKQEDRFTLGPARQALRTAHF